MGTGRWEGWSERTLTSPGMLHFLWFFLLTKEYIHMLIAEVNINCFFERWPYNIIFTEFIDGTIYEDEKEAHQKYIDAI